LSAEARAPERVTFTLNGREVTAPAGMILVDAAASHGVEIPIFCYEPRVGPPLGACRMCLVEIEGMRGLQTACSTPVAADMVVRTNSPLALDGQDGVLELLLANHPLDCPVCDKGGECPLQDRTFRFGPGRSRFIEPKRHFPKPLDLSPLIAIDRERCISCFRCTRFSQEVAEDGQLTFQERGGRSEIATYTGHPYVGRFTGNIVDLCPVGALTSIPYRFVARPWDVQNTPSVCPHCPVGCNTELTMREGQVKRVTGREVPNMEVEEGWLCDRGRWAYPGSWSRDRLREAVLLDSVARRRVPLQRAVDAAALMLRRAGDAAILVGPDATVEEAFVAQELAAGALGGAPVARLGLPGRGLEGLRALPAAQLADLDTADLVVVVGGDPANAQPVVELRIRKAHRRGARVLSVGPRPHPVEALGTVERTAPGRLVDGIAAVEAALLEAGAAVVLWDEVDLAAAPDAAVELARVVEAALVRGARCLELGSEVNGAGLRALGLPTADALLERIEGGAVGTLVLVHADPLESPGAERWRAALERVPRLLVVATHESPLTARAAIVMPACGPYEQEGVLAAMNGRAQRLRPGQHGPEGAAPAWEILVALSHRLGRALPYRSAAQAFAGAAASRPALRGVTYDSIGTLGQPLPRPEAPLQAGAEARREPEGEGLLLVPMSHVFGDRASARSDALAPVRAAAEVALHPAQAEALGLAAGDVAEIRSPHGSCALPVRVDPALAEGAAYVTVGAPGSGVAGLMPVDGAPVRVALARQTVEEDAAA
jgi:NADH-quinone oxidoreductase subunit G